VVPGSVGDLLCVELLVQFGEVAAWLAVVG
jgi:hypothetical protein